MNIPITLSLCLLAIPAIGTWDNPNTTPIVNRQNNTASTVKNVDTELQVIAEDIAADNPEVTPQLILAIADRESNLGEALDANGLGDNGNGCGIWQVDKRYHPDLVNSVNCATDHAKIARYAIERVLIPYSEELGSMELAIAAYNAGTASVKKAVAQGKSPDTVTTGKNYSVDVLARIEKFR